MLQFALGFAFAFFLLHIWKCCGATLRCLGRCRFGSKAEAKRADFVTKTNTIYITGPRSEVWHSKPDCQKRTESPWMTLRACKFCNKP